MSKPMTKPEFDAAVDRIIQRHLDRLAAARPPASAPDRRPRFKDGRLKNFVARVEEERDFEVLLDPVLGPPYYKEHKIEFDLYFQEKAKADVKERAQAALTAGGMKQSEFESGGRERADAEQKRAAIEARIRELEGQLPKPQEGETK